VLTVLDELDWELERRGHRFARYADDCNILVKSKRAGERVMASVTRYVSDTLRLTVNPLKSAVDRPMNRKFLGFTVSRNGAKLKVADKAIEKLRDRVRELTRRTRGISIGAFVAELRESLLGWKAYFGIAEVLSPLREIDKWVLCPLRCDLWKQWGPAGYRELRKRGVSVREACGTRANRRMARGGCRRRRHWQPRYHCASSKTWGYRILQRGRNSIHRTAGYVTRTSGGVGGGGREAFSYPDWASLGRTLATPAECPRECRDSSPQCP